MKTFIVRCSLFVSLFIILMVLLIFSLDTFESYLIKFEVPESRRTLIVGTSRPERAIDDKIVKNVYNFSKSGEGYLYFYLKIREILKDNSHIDTVILSYSIGDLSRKKDDWYNGPERMKFMMPKYLFLFDSYDFRTLFTSNPSGFILNAHRSVTESAKNIIRFAGTNPDLSRFGGFTPLNRKKLSEAINNFDPTELSKDQGNSKYQEDYLTKIYDLVMESGDIDLILLRLPVHPKYVEALDEAAIKYHYDFAAKNLPQAMILDHSSFQLPDSGYGDLTHLNVDGAKIYSEYLHANGFSPLH